MEHLSKNNINIQKLNIYPKTNIYPKSAHLSKNSKKSTFNYYFKVKKISLISID